MIMNKSIIVTGLFLLVIVFSGFTIACLFLGIPGYSGSPGDSGRTCADCHGGTVSRDTAHIFTDIPVTGYVPSDTYSVTILLDDTLHTYFELTSENNAIKNGKFISNGSTFTANNDKCIMSAYWQDTPFCTFKWVAPADVSLDSITFYSAVTFNETFETKTYNLKVLSYNSGISSNIVSETKIFMIAESNTLFVQYYLNDLVSTDISIYSISGDISNSLFSGNEISGLQAKYLKIPTDVKQGMYILQIIFRNGKGENTRLVRKIVIAK